MSELNTGSIVAERPSTETTKPKRKKTTRACNHCHKAHMTCDSSRPCKRCIQRGLDKTCEDAPRKRKKYLADVPNNVLINRPQSASPTMETVSRGSIPYQATVFQHSSTVPSNYIPTGDLYSAINYDQVAISQPQQLPQPYNRPRRTNFLSSAADLEYSTLSSILQDNFTSTPDGTPNSINISPGLSPHAINSQRSIASPNEYRNQQPISPYISASSQTSSPNDHAISGRGIRNSIYDKPQFPKCDENINQYFLGPTDSDRVSMFPDIITAIEIMKAVDPAVYHERNSKSALSFAIGITPDDNSYTSQENEFKEPEEIYAKVKKPFSYTPGFHSLIAYLRKRFPREMLVKMAESMAAYRPSFIACTNSLKEGDLIFMEQCFQRTLLTYDNLIKVSGTPTIVWRRTGEIAYVGNEFCILTGWPKEELVGKKRKFIVELLDDKSVVEYFQLFSRIAFGDFLGATMTECTLLTPKKDVKIRTGCMWTLKRDVFGIPMMIVGNFLPIV